MKVVLTVLARDEADIIDAQIAFHLNAGVDFVIATDNASRDGTTDILESYVREGCLHLIHEPAEGLRQGEWVTRMARLAAQEFGADWVINSDADEFWWPRGASLKEVLAAVPERYGIVQAFWHSFVPRPDDDAFFAERMTLRLSQHAPINDPTSFYRPSRSSGRDRRAWKPFAGGELLRAAAVVASIGGAPLSSEIDRAMAEEGGASGRCLHGAHRTCGHGLPPEGL